VKPYWFGENYIMETYLKIHRGLRYIKYNAALLRPYKAMN